MTRAYVRGGYPLWLCVTCCMGVASNRWRLHRRRCQRIAEGTVCERCGDFVPCRRKGKWMCPAYEPRVEVDAEQVPDVTVVRSLGMQVKRTGDGRWAVRAAWLDGPVIADSWADAYWLAVRAKGGG